MFPSDDKLKKLVTSDEFRMLLLTDASTDDVQDFLATYYEIKNWAQVKKKLIDKGVNIAARYSYLLLTVKTTSKQTMFGLASMRGYIDMNLCWSHFFPLFLIQQRMSSGLKRWVLIISSNTSFLILSLSMKHPTSV